MAKTSTASIQKSLKGLDYPATKQDLIDRAKQNNGGNEVMDILNQLPDRQFNSPADVNKEAGEIR